MSWNQPPHRRPSWAKDEKTYETYMRNDSVASRRSSTNTPDYYPENFAYDPGHLSRWSIPEAVVRENPPFPEELRTELHDWSLAGAAVCTSLERIRRLRKDSIKRGWPSSNAFASLSHSAGAGTPASVSAQSSVSSPIDSPTMTRSTSATSSPQMIPYSTSPGSSFQSTMSSVSGIMPPRSSQRMESPPVSPMGSLSQSYLAQQKASFIEFAKLEPELGVALFERLPEDCSFFDQVSWETYVNQFENELYDLRRNAMARWKGYAKRVDVIAFEANLEEQYKPAIEAFRNWWEPMKGKLRDYDELVQVLDGPDLEDMKAKRMSMQLPL